MRRPTGHAGFALCLLLAVAWASGASARTERLRWQHGDSGVDSYRVYWGGDSGSLVNQEDVNAPAFDPSADGGNGAYYHDLQVPDSLVLYVVVTAWKGGLESVPSNMIVRTAPGGDPDPDPDPPPGGANAAVVGFALWDAQNDQVVDPDFRSGETIPASISGCAAIEIQTNSYLRNDGPGSVKKVFDGLAHSCGTQGANQWENVHPYAWEDGAQPGAFACSSSLSQPGQHSLTVIPFDGDDCTGAAGASVTLTFEVEGSSGSPGDPLGMPGQPYLVSP